MARMTTQDEIRKSVFELRKIYGNLSDKEFAAWYSRKYKISDYDVYSLIKEGERHA